VACSVSARLVACPSAVHRPGRASKGNQKGNGPPRKKPPKQETKRRLTFNLLLFHLESTALSLDRLLQADDGGALLLEGTLLVRVRDAEGYQLPVEPRDLGIPLLQRLPRPLESGTLPLERRPGVSKGGQLLLELALGLLAGGTLLPELFLRRGERGDLGGEGGLQLIGLLGLLLGFPRPLLGPTLLGLRLPEPRAELPVLDPDGSHLRLPVRRHGAHLLQAPSPAAAPHPDR
jgi:hypothetical protein